MTDHDHDTISEAGKCPDCRASNIDLVSEAPHAFLLLWARPGASDIEALATVRSHSEHIVIETAWATGCDPGEAYGVGIIGPMAPENLVKLDVPWFQLIAGPDATAALARITSPGGVALVDGFRAAMRNANPYSEYGVPFDVSPN
jgi:hypothetical protein